MNKPINNKKYGVFSNTAFVLKKNWEACRSKSAVKFISDLTYRAYRIYFSVFFLGYIFKIIEAKSSFSNAFWLIFVSVALLLACDYLSAWYFCAYKEPSELKVTKALKFLVCKKAMDADMSCYENPEFYNRYTRVSLDIVSRFDRVVSDFSALVCDLITGAYLAWTIFISDAAALAICVVPLIIKFTVGKKLNSVKYSLYKDNVELIREKEYAKRTSYLKDYAKEIRTTNIFRVIRAKYEQASLSVIKNINRYGLRISVLSFFNSNIVMLTAYFLALIYVVYKASQPPIGDIVILINAIYRLSGILIGFVNGFLSLNEHSMYIDDIREFLARKPQIRDGEREICADQFEISFENVSFAYEGAAQKSLSNINLTIRDKEKIAIVGVNGAGKTTLVKLLMRLYDVTGGAIRLNGIDIREYRISSYRSIFSAVFQDYKIFAAT
ncbi:MAG TPA: ABC transporter ATP-binding protein, partial [Clostridia bacterium]|nr:ABC transporter ATP-binding protein [Clostridia bacterium]